MSSVRANVIAFRLNMILDDEQTTSCCLLKETIVSTDTHTDYLASLHELQLNHFVHLCAVSLFRRS